MVQMEKIIKMIIVHNYNFQLNKIRKEKIVQQARSGGYLSRLDGYSSASLDRYIFKCIKSGVGGRKREQKKLKRQVPLILLIDPDRGKTVNLRTWNDKENLKENHYTLLLYVYLEAWVCLTGD